MEVLRSYLNHLDQGKRISQILRAAPSRGASLNPRRKKQVSRKLRESEIEMLLADYESGVYIKDLVQKYQIHHVTIQKYLHRSHVPSRHRRKSSCPSEEVVALYAEGKSMVEVGRLLSISASTVSRALDRAGVLVRSQGRRF